MKTTEEIARIYLQQGRSPVFQVDKWYSEEEVNEMINEVGKLIGYDEAKQILLDKVKQKFVGEEKDD